MGEIKIITRADDCGADRVSTLGCLKSAEAGFIKDVSFMAGGTYIEEAAELFRGKKELCKGFHFTMFSEWDKVKWRPISAPDKISSLLDEDGGFFQRPEDWVRRGLLDMDEIYREWSAQLDYLTRLGLDISYGDTHMLPEIYWKELLPEMNKWMEKKGLLNHREYYGNVVELKENSIEEAKDIFGKLDSEQYFFLFHPAVPGEEMKLWGNSEVNGETVGANRAREWTLLTNPLLLRACDESGIQCISYREAERRPSEKSFRWGGAEE